MSQDFVGGGSAGVAALRKDQKLPVCQTEPVPDGSKKDLLLAKTEPITDSGDT